MLAAGGDPHRELDPHGRAVVTLAGDLDDLERRAELATGLEELDGQAHGLPAVEGALAALRADPDAAWRWLAVALLADELSAD